MKKRLVCLVLSALPLAVIAQTTTAPAADTGRSITLLVGYSAGGSTDTVARVLATGLSNELGQTVIVDNKPGASAMLAAGQLARSAPDGQTLMLAASPTFTMTPHIQSTKAANPLPGLVPVANVLEYANALVVKPDFPAKSLAEFVAYARRHPGQITYGSSGVGSSNHLSAALLASLTGTSLSHIPYKGNAPAMVDVVGGQISFMFDIVNTAIPQIKAGKVRAIAVTSPKRNDALPDVPTALEGGVKGLDLTGWFGVVAPPQTPAPVAKRYQDALQRIAADPTYVQRFKDMGYSVRFQPAAEFATRIQSDRALWGTVVKDAGIERQE